MTWPGDLSGMLPNHERRLERLETGNGPRYEGGALVPGGSGGGIDPSPHGHASNIDGGVLTSVIFVEGAAPSTPSTGYVYVYAKSDGKMYAKDDAGTEYDLTAGGGGGSVATDTIWDAKGDLAVGTGANTAAKLTATTNGFVLTLDSGEATGMKWAAAGSGAVATDTIWDAAGDIARGTGADTAARYALSVPAANVLNVLAVANGETTFTWKALFDATNPAAIGTAGPGTSLIGAHRDHIHAAAAAAVTADSTTLVGTGTTVQAVFEELDDAIATDIAALATHAAHADPHTGYRLESADHSHATTGAQGGTVAAAVITADSTTLVGVGTNVQAVLEELDNGIADHLADTTDAHDSDSIAYVPATTTDWGGSDPGDVEQALDVLADRTSKGWKEFDAANLVPSYDRAAWVTAPNTNTEPTNDYIWRGLKFGGSSKQYAAGSFRLPANYDGGTITAQYDWRNVTGGGTGTVIWGCQMLALGDGDAGDAAMGTAIEVTDTILDANDFHISAASGAITPAGTAQAGDRIFFEIYRDGTNDTNNSDQHLVGIIFVYGLTAAGVA